MTWEQKIQAVGSLVGGVSGVALHMRKPGDWYVLASRLDRKEGPMISSGGCSGSSPEDAVEKFWRWATDERYYMVVQGGGSARKAARWTGYMWENVEETTSARP